ncbi:MAG: hypothetical protein JRJ31_14775 [Deltaproteobacteria bacterium]|nr:hypothetical protein [Deltaproteobacteria bacterium]
MLSNIYLHSFDKMFQLSGIPGTLVRYADDFVILLRRNGKKVVRQVERMLGRLGLKLHPEKTRVVRAEDGFEFLGIHFQRCSVRMKNAKEKNYCALWPSDRSITVLRGWDNYQRKAMSARKRVVKLNGFVRDRLRIFLKRKYSDQSRGTRRVHDNLPVRLGLYQFG